MKRRTLLLWLGLAAGAQPSQGFAQDGTRSERIGGSAPAELQAGGIRRYVFVGVGIDSFAVGAPWANLSNAVNDVAGVREILEDRYQFVPPDTIGDWVLTNDEATRDGILDLLERLPDAIQEGDALVFFYAGHGGEFGESGYLVPHDVKKGLEARLRQYIDVDLVVEQLRDLAATHVMLILDSCQSGLALRGLQDAPTTEEINQAIEKMQQNPSRLIVTSAQANENAKDGDGPLLDHSLFTGHLVMGLRRAAEGAAMDAPAVRRNLLKAEDLFGYVRDRVATRGSGQTPAFGGFLEGDSGPRGHFVLEFEVSPFEAAFGEAEELWRATPRSGDFQPFVDAAARALDAAGSEDAPRARYLEYRMASVPGKVNLVGQIEAARHLLRYQEEGLSLPLSNVGDLLAAHEDYCAATSCPAARAPSN